MSTLNEDQREAAQLAEARRYGASTLLPMLRDFYTTALASEDPKHKQAYIDTVHKLHSKDNGAGSGNVMHITFDFHGGGVAVETTKAEVVEDAVVVDAPQLENTEAQAELDAIFDIGSLLAEVPTAHELSDHLKEVSREGV